MSGSMAALPRQGIIILTYVLAALELTCLFMQFSILPYLSRTLGLDSVSFGYLQTTFGVLQLLGGPVFGRFADQCGARAALSLSFLAASALYLLLVASCSPALPGVFLLFASRIPSAFMHTLPAAQMVITDLTAPTERPAALGRLGLCFGIGIIFGSLLGGTLNTAYGIQCPAILAFVVTLLGAVLSFTCVPATTKEASVQSAPQGGTKASVFDLKAITRLLLLPRVLPVFLVKVISGFPSGLFLVMFSIISMDFFQLEAAQSGYLMSFFGILQMVSGHEQRGLGFSASASGSGHPGFLLNHLGCLVLSDKVPVEKHTHREKTLSSWLSILQHVDPVHASMWGGGQDLEGLKIENGHLIMGFCLESASVLPSWVT
ncbi:solute carrier family 22 member 18 isoform X1 [Mus caroli]|uniref:Solute carrier family 22 member 18 isoform X1 n=1 Tax=Mus caroli TaxID=10089 RepID=A0A6P7R3S2_MUSCR|nr:solute carrier family 22 member 18 isoform X1 [Mus caroli]XP_029335259.1 solute carrier family 22 member 18 isoform X1 [Mus caroli]XP_029335260.1 solute carrier family 22 member 18 isoform X1 [Mus caroli]XP_029335261.1 solute carrier family 22 member 18 isoform X1 [Mus caroli]XP_029335262.1 solute carrier family 22 member 18 isoform X1 [Mus caroli]